MVPHHLPELSDFGCYFPCPVAYRQSARVGATPRMRLRLGVRSRGKASSQTCSVQILRATACVESDIHAPSFSLHWFERVESWTCYPCLIDLVSVRGFTFVLLFIGLGMLNILRQESRMKQYSAARSYSCTKPPAEHSLCLYD